MPHLPTAADATAEAERIGRRVVTVAFAHDRLSGRPLWLWSAIAAAEGRDPWFEVTEVASLMAEPDYIVRCGNGELLVPPDFRLFALRVTVEALAVPSPPLAASALATLAFGWVHSAVGG
jgi:hypothetical protein